MTDSDLEVVFQLMNVDVKRNKVSCPLAPWTHSKGTDKNPSGSVRPGTPAIYNCFSCHSKGTVRSIAKKYYEHSGDSRAYDYIRKIEPYSLKEKFTTTGSYEDQKKKLVRSSAKRLKKEQKKIFDESYLEEFKRVIPFYAKERGLTKQDVVSWEIGFDQSRERMTFTIRDYTGALMGYSGRDVTGQREPKYYHYPGLTKEAVFYGENKMDRSSKRVYIVEGFFDTIMLMRAGLKNVFCTMGTSISEYQISKLKRWFTEIVFIPDGDFEGLRFAEIYSRRLLLKFSKVGIGCVTKNPNYEKRKKPSTWEDKDFRYVLNQNFLTRDPSDLVGEELKDVLNKIEWVDLTEMSD